MKNWIGRFLSHSHSKRHRRPNRQKCCRWYSDICKKTVFLDPIMRRPSWHCQLPTIVLNLGFLGDLVFLANTLNVAYIPVPKTKGTRSSSRYRLYLMNVLKPNPTCLKHSSVLTERRPKNENFRLTRSSQNFLT
jgi:hypothetical protein